MYPDNKPIFPQFNNSSDILDFTRNMEKSNNRSQDHWLQISKAQTFPCILGASK